MKYYNNLKDKEKFFTCFTINTIEDLHNFLNQIEGKTFVFRGVKNAAYMNYSSAQVNSQGAFSQEEYNNVIDESIALVRKSKKLMKLLRKRSKDNSDSEILALLQHYGCGTPFLDYSYKFNYGVFFALDGMSEEYNSDRGDIDNYCSIYFFNWLEPNHLPIQYNSALSINDLEECDKKGKNEYGKLYKGLHESVYTSYKLPYREMISYATGGLTIASRSGGVIDIDSPQTGLHVTYDITNERDDIQKGLFKFNPSSDIPYEEAALKWYSGMNKRNYCLNIHKSLKQQLISEFLQPLNICTETVYPKTKYGNKVIREILKLPMDSALRPRNPQNLSPKTINKYNSLYKKRVIKHKTKTLPRHTTAVK